ncbi:ankyrin repeat domain-containing protein [Marinobacter sp.]|uniref:ankyrin repeat domain-containing protein n=1 Tax=Marinobacter sp. TaxID=50741 RepID=UPI0035647134
MSSDKPARPEKPQNELDEDAIAFAQGIFELARNGGTGVLATLLDAGVPVDVRTSEGESLLMLAVRNGHTDTANLLLESGANPELRDARGNTAGDLARAGGNTDMIRLFSRQQD